MKLPPRVTGAGASAIVLWLVHACVTAPRASGYPVGPALSLEKLESESDVIFKGEVIAGEPVQDDWFKPVEGFGAVETRFKLISTIKGQLQEGEVRFRHYDRVPAGGFSYMPQFYHFEPGRSYIVVADKTDGGTRQVLRSHTLKMDLGVLRCRDDRPVRAKVLKEIYWEELMALRDSAAPADIVYAIE